MRIATGTNARALPQDDSDVFPLPCPAALLPRYSCPPASSTLFTAIWFTNNRSLCLLPGSVSA